MKAISKTSALELVGKHLAVQPAASPACRAAQHRLAAKHWPATTTTTRGGRADGSADGAPRHTTALLKNQDHKTNSQPPGRSSGQTMAVWATAGRRAATVERELWTSLTEGRAWRHRFLTAREATRSTQLADSLLGRGLVVSPRGQVQL